MNTGTIDGRGQVRVQISISAILFAELEQIAASLAGESRFTVQELIAELAESEAAKRRLETLGVASE